MTETVPAKMGWQKTKMTNGRGTSTDHLSITVAKIVVGYIIYDNYVWDFSRQYLSDHLLHQETNDCVRVGAKIRQMAKLTNSLEGVQLQMSFWTKLCKDLPGANWSINILFLLLLTSYSVGGLSSLTDGWQFEIVFSFSFIKEIGHSMSPDLSD